MASVRRAASRALAAPRLERHAHRDAVKPRPQPLAVSERLCFPHEDEERGLEGVIDVGAVDEHPPADAEHHRPVPAQEHVERRVFAVAGETLEEFGVGQLIEPAAAKDLAKSRCGELLRGKTSHTASMPCSR